MARSDADEEQQDYDNERAANGETQSYPAWPVSLGGGS
jgi:hypothetical protein